MDIRNRMEKVSKKKKKAITPFRAGMLLQGAKYSILHYKGNISKNQISRRLR